MWQYAHLLDELKGEENAGDNLSSRNGQEAR